MRRRRLRPTGSQQAHVLVITESAGLTRVARTWPSSLATTSPGLGRPQSRGRLPDRRLRLTGCTAKACASATPGSGSGLDARSWTPGRHPRRRCRRRLGCRATCRIGYCDVWVRGTSVFCATTTTAGRRADGPTSTSSPPPTRVPGPAGPSTSTCTGCRCSCGWRCSTCCSAAATRPAREDRPGQGSSLVIALADLAPTPAVASLLDRPEESWSSLPITRRERRPPAGRALHWTHATGSRTSPAAAAGTVEYPREVWRLRNLGIARRHAATIRFAEDHPAVAEGSGQAVDPVAAGQPASRPATVRAGVRAIQPGSPASCPPGSPRPAAQLDRAAAGTLPGRPAHRVRPDTAAHGHHIGAAERLPRARSGGTAGTTPSPPARSFYPRGLPQGGPRLPRALAEHVMAQLERPGQPRPVGRPCLPADHADPDPLRPADLRRRSSSPRTCVVTRRDGAPYLRYYNHKMKREALVPIDEELHRQSARQQQRRCGAGPPARRSCSPPQRNLRGAQADQHAPPTAARWPLAGTLRHPRRTRPPGAPDPHQWRHTLGTRLINRDVPQEVVRRILDHDSHADDRPLRPAVRRHHPTALGERPARSTSTATTVALDPDGPLAEAAWAKQRLSRATQALPNGYCGLPLVQAVPARQRLPDLPAVRHHRRVPAPAPRQHRQTLQIISAAEARGQARMAEMNQQVAGNLEKIITALRSRPGGPARRAADAP